MSLILGRLFVLLRAVPWSGLLCSRGRRYRRVAAISSNIESQSLGRVRSRSSSAFCLNNVANKIDEAWGSRIRIRSSVLLNETNCQKCEVAARASSQSAFRWTSSPPFLLFRVTHRNRTDSTPLSLAFLQERLETPIPNLSVFVVSARSSVHYWQLQTINFDDPLVSFPLETLIHSLKGQYRRLIPLRNRYAVSTHRVGWLLSQASPSDSSAAGPLASQESSNADVPQSSDSCTYIPTYM